MQRNHSNRVELRRASDQLTHHVSAAQHCHHSQDEHDGRGSGQHYFSAPDKPRRHYPRTFTTDIISDHNGNGDSDMLKVACSAFLSLSGFVKRSCWI